LIKTDKGKTQNNNIFRFFEYDFYNSTRKVMQTKPMRFKTKFAFTKKASGQFS
jgi:hypothetical protein